MKELRPRQTLNPTPASTNSCPWCGGFVAVESEEPCSICKTRNLGREFKLAAAYIPKKPVKHATKT